MNFFFPLILLLLPAPAFLSQDASLLSVTQRISRDTKTQGVKVLVSEPCVEGREPCESKEARGTELELEPGAPLVLTHRIRLVQGSGGCAGCEGEFAALRARIERLEKEVSELREKCGGPEGGCCTSQQSKGVVCTTVRPPTDECPDDCSDQGRCVDGKCVCFPGFSGPSCNESDCPGNCSNKGKCVNGQCECDPGFTGSDCSTKACPKNCSKRGRCVNGKCVCDSGFTGLDCSSRGCPGNCNNQGKCLNGKCVCVSGFFGRNCSEKSCPKKCNNKGRCVNGQCMCNAGFSGPDCSVRTCPANCNSQGRCLNGKCICQSGFSGPDCSERTCPRNCSNKGRCNNGQCVCHSGYTGPDCSKRTCPGSCSNKGRCNNGQCVCDSGYTGLDCSERTCPGNCSKKGRCLNGQCVCNEGFAGPDCSEKTCPSNCNNYGRCVNGKCVCETGFSGPDCSTKSCPNDCSDRGQCVDGQCVCEAGFTGPDCSTKSCLNDCSDRGQCVDGQCVCEAGFTGPDCSTKSCPNDCSDRGQCVDGQCVCKAGFTGPDCSTKSCPSDCSERGQCVDGQCVCEAGFTGPDCSTKSCPNDCSDRGQCVDGQCVCEAGFTGPDCSTKSCLNNCNNKGSCVDGKCVCDVGFSGQDCSAKSCLNNCSNKGRCMRGRCMCRRGFALPDCSECEAGFTGPDCATALSGVTGLSTRDITESSVILLWTPPSVQYDNYLVTFTSTKEGDQRITSKVNGRLTSYSQSGLAAGQRYTVTITGEKDGKTGAQSATEFQTLIAGPKDLGVVKTSTTSVIVQWEQALGEIDRYILYVSPNQTDGSGQGIQEMKLPPERNSAQIEDLEPGRLYDISLVAEKDGSRSLPATVQATPGTTTKTLPKMAVETVTLMAVLESDRSDSKTSGTNIGRTAVFRKNQGLGEMEQKKPLRAQVSGSSEDASTLNINISSQLGPSASTRPGQRLSTQPGHRPMFFPRPGSRPDTIRRPNVGMLRVNGTRIHNGGGRVSTYPLKKPTGRYLSEGPGAKKPLAVSGLRPPISRESKMALAMKETGSKGHEDESPSRTKPVSHTKNGTDASFSLYQPITSGNGKHADSVRVSEVFQTISAPTEEPLEPTYTTERNLTAHINGTKCVRKVLVGHKKVHINGGSHGNGQTKNMTVIVGHVNGNDLLEKLFIGGISSTVDAPLKRAHPQLDKKKVEEVKHVTSEPTSFAPKVFSEKPMKVDNQVEEAGTRLPYSSPSSPPPPSLPLASSLPIPFPSKIPKSHPGTSQQLTKRRTTGTSPKMPLIFRNKLEKKTPGIQNRPFTNKTSAQIFKEKHPIRNSHSEPLSPTLSLGPKITEGRLTASQGSVNDTQGLKYESVQRSSAAPSLTKETAQVISDIRKMGAQTEGGIMEPEKARNGTSPLFRRTPFRSTIRKGPFLSRTSPILKPLQHPQRNPLHRPILPRIPNRDNITVRQPTPKKQAETGINISGLSAQFKPGFSARGKNGTFFRLSSNLHRQLRINATTIPSGNQDNKHELSTTDNPTVTTNETSQAVIRDSEDSIDHVMQTVINRGDIRVKQNVPYDQVKPETISSPQNGSNLNLKPGFMQSRKNGTVISLPLKHTQVKPKATAAQHPKGNKESKGETADKDPNPGLPTDTDKGNLSKVTLSTETGANKEPKYIVPVDVYANIDSEVTLTTEKSATETNNTFKDRDSESITARPKVTQDHMKPDTISKRQNGSNLVTPALTLRRQNGTVTKIPQKHTQLKPKATLTRSDPKRRIESKAGKGSNAGLVDVKDARKDPKPSLIADTNTGKISRANLPVDIDASKEPNVGVLIDKDPKSDSKFILTRDKPAIDTTASSQSAAGDSEKRYDPQATTIAARQRIPHVQVKPKIIGSRQSGSNLTVRPALPGKRQNTTVLRFRPKQTQSKAKGSLAHGNLKGSQMSSVGNGSKAGLLADQYLTKDTKPNRTLDREIGKASEVAPSTGKDKNQEPKIAHIGDKTANKSKGAFAFLKPSENGIDHVGIQNVTSTGFIIIWGAPRGIFQNFIITVREQERGKSGQGEQGSEDKEDHKVEQVNISEDARKKEENERETNVIDRSSKIQTVKRNGSDDGGVIKTFTKVVPDSFRLYPVTDLIPQTGYFVSLIGNGPGLRSNTHTLIISTGPEPPSNLVFSKVTDSSLTVSWTKPKNPVSGFKVTYTHKEDGEPFSVSVDSTDSAVDLSKLSPGSSYEVSVISVLGLDESDPISRIAFTLPDTPADLRTINVTETKALLLWRPALATVDQYVIVYGSEEVPGSELTVQVSGNAAEQQLQALKASTKYTVTIVSQLGDRRSPGSTTFFTTTSGSGGRGDGPRNLTASQVTPRTAVLSWKPPAAAVTGYKLIYFTEGQEIKEVLLEPNITEHKLMGLHHSSNYTARLQAQRGALYTAAISTDFTTGVLKYPFPTDCSQELMNGMRQSGVTEIFPGGREPVRVYCDMETDGGGWTVFQRRKDGKTDFFRSWQQYSRGFGDLDGEFWLGNDLLHNLTTVTSMSLRVDLRSGNESVFAAYSSFSVDTMKKHYMIGVSGYSGTAGDSLKYHDKRPFSTKDRDPEPYITRCAMSYRGGWWYRNCHEANLNGLYNTHTNHQGVIWTAWKGKDFSIPFAEMKLRPTSFNPRSQG